MQVTEDALTTLSVVLVVCPRWDSNPHTCQVSVLKTAASTVPPHGHCFKGERLASTRPRTLNQSGAASFLTFVHGMPGRSRWAIYEGLPLSHGIYLFSRDIAGPVCQIKLRDASSNAIFVRNLLTDECHLDIVAPNPAGASHGPWTRIPVHRSR